MESTANLAAGGDVADKVDDTVGVAALVVVPADKLDEGVVKSDTRLRIEDGRVLVANDVHGDKVLLAVGEDALELALGGGLDGLADLLVGGRLLNAAGEVNNGASNGGNTEGHAVQLALEGRQNEDDSLGGTSGGRDDVDKSRTATTPVLLGRTVDSRLSGGDGMDGRHETLNDAELVMDDLGKRRKAVRGARGVVNNGHLGLELSVVDTHDEGRGIGGRAADNNVLNAATEVLRGASLVLEDASGLKDDLDTARAPVDDGGVTLLEEADELAVDLDTVLNGLDALGDVALSGVVSEHVDGVLGLDHGIVDSHNLDVVVLKRSAEGHTANTAKTIDTNLNHKERLRSGCPCHAIDFLPASVTFPLNAPNYYYNVNVPINLPTVASDRTPPYRHQPNS